MGGSEPLSGQRKRKLTVAEILRVSAGRYVERFPKQAALQVQSTLAKLAVCRTPVLGGRRYRCHQCTHECVIYNSCGDRHCPQCAGAKRADWMDSSSCLFLDGVDYFQVVFTLPSQLSRLALGNRRAIYDLLFTSAWRALKQTIESEQGYDAAALMVLHTWNQKLDAHGHVHAIVPGGGPATDGNGWRVSRRADDALSVGGYLVDATALREAYRDHFLPGLNRLWAAGKLKLQGEFAVLQSAAGWQAFTAPLETTDWVSHIQPPENCSHDRIVKYLARYLTGGPISDARIVSANEHEVTFLAREGRVTGGQSKQVPITLSAVEFTRRWALHVLPKAYKKSRRFGGWSNPRRDNYLEQCSKQLEAVEAPSSADACEFDPYLESAEGAEETSDCCPRCGAAMILQEQRHKPSWSEVMQSSDRPIWYSPPPCRPSLPAGTATL